MEQDAHSGYPIIPRKDLDFQFEQVPRHWFGGDPFKTRFFDALSLLFPEGEKFFIECVRDYRDQVADPQAQAEIRDFIMQEGQHGMVHMQYNNRLKNQGIEVDQILSRQVDILKGYRRRTPRWFTLSLTVAAEHMTAIMAHSFMTRSDIFNESDPRMRALYVWHGVEEIEHKGVAFDVLTKVAKANYFQRIAGLLWESLLFPMHTFLIMNYMLKVDGVKQRWKVWLKGLWWLYGPRGLYVRLMPHYLAYYLPGFHPWRFGQTRTMQTWLDAYQRHGDPIAASEQVLQSQLASTSGVTS